MVFLEVLYFMKQIKAKWGFSVRDSVSHTPKETGRREKNEYTHGLIKVPVWGADQSIFLQARGCHGFVFHVSKWPLWRGIKFAAVSPRHVPFCFCLIWKSYPSPFRSPFLGVCFGIPWIFFIGRRVPATTKLSPFMLLSHFGLRGVYFRITCLVPFAGGLFL